MSRTVDWSTLTQKVGEATVIVPCMSFVLFLDLTEDRSMLDFYSRCRDALGDRLTHYQAEGMNGYSKLNPRANAMVPTWLTQPRKGKVDYYMSMAAGDPDKGSTASQLELSLFRRPASEWTGEAKTKELAKRQRAHEENRIIGPRPATMLRVTLPLDHPLSVAFVEWISNFEILSGDLAFSGYGGFAVNYFGQAARSSIYEPTQRLLAALLLRHPGLDWDGGGVQPRIVRYQPERQDFRILTKRVNWINVLSEQVVAYLGGKAELSARLASDAAVTVREVGRAVVALAGREPQFGDIGHRDFLPQYRHVERVLRPARIDDIDGLGAHFGPALTNEWLNAFIKEYE